MRVTALCRNHGFSDASFYTLRGKFCGMEVSEARRRKAAVYNHRSAGPAR